MFQDIPNEVIHRAFGILVGKVLPSSRSSTVGRLKQPAAILGWKNFGQMTPYKVGKSSPPSDQLERRVGIGPSNDIHAPRDKRNNIHRSAHRRNFLPS
jgi:hypothetical protein